MRCAKSIVFYFEEPMNISNSTNFRFIKVFTFLKFTIKISMENTIYETLGLSENSANEKKTSSDYGQKFIENVLDCWDIRHVVMLNFQFDVSKIV